MSIAKKSDICNKFYEPYNVRNCAEKPNGFMLLNIDNTQNYFSHKITDCCPSCMSRLQAYIEYIKENQNDRFK